MLQPARTIATALAAFLLASPALAAPPGLSEAQSIALGRALAVRNCGMCHAVERTGASPNPAAPPFRELHRRMDVEMLGEGLTQGILTGHPAMPQFRFEPQEVVGIVRYLRAIQERQSTEATTPSRAGL
jgi:mono/diheme cytochrome c family protein